MGRHDVNVSAKHWHTTPEPVLSWKHTLLLMINKKHGSIQEHSDAAFDQSVKSK